MSKMRIIRKHSLIDNKFAYKIYLDNYYVGKIRDGECLEYDILPGKHTIYFKMNYLSSRKINFKVEKENRCFEVNAGSNQIHNIFNMVFDHDAYIELSQRSV